MREPLNFRIGNGFDVHRLVEGRPLIMGGVSIPHEKGLLGHSDADVLLHSLMDAILGAMNMGDIGVHFPPSDDKYKGISSIKLLKHVKSLMDKSGFRIQNCDNTIIAEQPKMKPHIPEMQKNIADALCISPDRVSIKATTTEKLGFTGRQEGIAAMSSVLLYRE